MFLRAKSSSESSQNHLKLDSCVIVPDVFHTRQQLVYNFMKKSSNLTLFWF